MAPNQGIRVVAGVGDDEGSLLDHLSADRDFVLIRAGDSLNAAVRTCGEYSPCILLANERLTQALAGEEHLSSILPARVRVIGIVDAGAETDAKQLVRKGFSGLIPAAAPSATVPKAVRAVSGGELWLKRRLMSEIVRELLARTKERFTQRELEVLALVGAAHSNQEIADRLFISRETVRWHLRSLYAKTGATNRTELQRVVEGVEDAVGDATGAM